MNMKYDEIIALRKAFQTVKKKQQENFPPDFRKKTQRLKAIRESSVGNQALLQQAVEKIEKNGIRVFYAKSKADALQVVFKELDNEKLVVKAKSNVSKEIGLVAALESKGIEVIDTDIGDRVLQVLREDPSHPTGPVAHLSAKTIAERLSEFHHKDVDQDAAAIVKFVKGNIEEYLVKAHVGITGANAITAEEGAIVIAHNEGNIFQVMRKKKHIVVTAIDKVYPTVEDALNMIKIICFNATGALIPSFVEIISGVSKTADIEKKFFKGVHAPEDVVLILLDNRRTDIIDQGYKEILSCVDCGNCLLFCPMYTTIGNQFASGKNLGGKGLALSSLTSEELDKKLELCLTCGHCKRNCPLEIDIPSIIRKLRSKNLPEELYYFLKSHLLWLYFNIKLKIH